MIIFLWIFATVYVLSYVSIYNYLDNDDTLWAITFNTVFLVLAIRLVYNSYRYKEKREMILFIILGLFIILANILIIVKGF
ncbi:hypothetical protein CAI16_17165 [Virgibacillus dokdonensis]|uniref:Group-specific protein n=1 Tax=Virgibacillus dokdonensis TaxID=302167 RepID=A0A3E0WIX0_9BACI|nr:hypothetical protein CAI16_17165 [Virgibacillus dokdonensis]